METEKAGQRGAERFVFGIPLIARSRAADWERVDALLGLTLCSVLAQDDPDFEVLLAGHDVPPCWPALTAGDRRFRFLPARHEAERPTGRNDDAGIKKWAIKEEVTRGGGGLLMYLDADDLVARNTVAAARAGIGPVSVGGVLARGVILDVASGQAAALPDPRIYDGGFHELCGSSTIARIEPTSDDPVRRDPYEVLGSHHVWPERAAEAGLRLDWLEVWGAYLVNSGQNHSETYGSHAEWRRTLNAALLRAGHPFGPDLAARFGLGPDALASLAASRPPLHGRRFGNAGAGRRC